MDCVQYVAMKIGGKGLMEYVYQYYGNDYVTKYEDACAALKSGIPVVFVQRGHIGLVKEVKGLIVITDEYSDGKHLSRELDYYGPYNYYIITGGKE
mgnify:FL=1